MFKAIILGAASSQMQMLPQQDEAFLEFSAKFGKSYATRAEYEARRSIFAEMFEKVNQFNGSHEIGLNRFADLTNEEWVAKLGY